jgi:hypothetical protein
MYWRRITFIKFQTLLLKMKINRFNFSLKSNDEEKDELQSLIKGKKSLREIFHD